MTAQKDFDVSSGGSQVLMFRGHPDYDAYRVEFDSNNSGSTATDVTFKVDSDTIGDAPAFGSFDATMDDDSVTGLDVSTGDPHVGSMAAGRTVAVEINETGNTNGAEGTVYAHNASDPAQNADAFAQR